MSQQQPNFAFVFGTGNPQDFTLETEDQLPTNGTMNPVDLHTSWFQPPPAQLPLGPNDAALEAENWPRFTQSEIDDLTASESSPANPPANIPAWQGATTTPEQPPALHNTPAEEAENMFRSAVPTNGGNFFGPATASLPNRIPAPQTVQQSGPGYRLGRVDDARRAEMEAGGWELKEKKKLGPRRPKRKADEVEEEPDAGPSAKKGGRPGPQKSAAGQAGRTTCMRQHQRYCQETGCGDGCWLKEHWPEEHARLQGIPIEIPDKDGMRPSTALWKHLKGNLSNCGDKGRKKK